MKLPNEYLARMQGQLQDAYPAYLSAMEQPPRAALRVNTLKIPPEAFAALLPVPLIPLSDCTDGFLVPDGFRPGTDPLHAAGLYYMQEASAQVPARLPKIASEMAILDLCAAPGGKSTQLAARMRGSGVLVANEVVPSRANVLCGNLERMGVANAIVTRAEPRLLCRRLRAQFDVVLCDAPCAGEGMFRKDPRAIAEWSPEHVAACAIRERGILNDAAEAVKPGGQLVYSTCSFSPAEDEETILLFLRSHPDFSLLSEQKLYPHTSDGEGQYMAHLVRRGERIPSVFRLGTSDRSAAWRTFSEAIVPLSGQILFRRNGDVLLVPALPFALDDIPVLRAGLLLGTDKGKYFVPSHALALAAPQTPLLRTEPLDESEALRYLRGEPIPRETEKGWCAATFRGFALGLMKADGTQMKNHYPKGLRLL